MQYSIFDKEIKVFGIAGFDENKRLEKFPEQLRKKLTEFHLQFGSTDIDHIATRTTGARAAFVTNSENVKIEMKLKTLAHDVGMSRFSCSSAAVYSGNRKNPVFRGLAVPGFDDMTGDISFRKENKAEEIMIFFPRNEIVEDIIITLDDGAEISPAEDYTYSKPVIFFGSSITEGGHASLVTNAYTALLSRRLDFEYYNFGLSGSCLGQTEIAEYICSLDPSVLVYDYDHNAFSAEYLLKTHERFFNVIRERKPYLPVVFMSTPNYDYMPEADERRRIIKSTYLNALNSGDDNVYFIDGKDLFGTVEREFCTTDTTHPNDLGFHRMADAIEPVMKEILEGL